MRMLNLIYLCMLSIAFIDCAPHKNCGDGRYCTTASINCLRVCETKDFRYSEINGLLYVIESTSPLTLKCNVYIARHYEKPYSFFVAGETPSPQRTTPIIVATGNLTRGEKGTGISMIAYYDTPPGLITYDTLLLADYDPSIGYFVIYSCQKSPNSPDNAVLQIVARKLTLNASTVANIHQRIESLGVDISDLAPVDQTNCY